MTAGEPWTPNLSTEWLGRIALAVAILVVGTLGVVQSLGLALQHMPERAHAIARSDGHIMARVAQKLLVSNPSAMGQAAAGRLAREALRQDPTAVRAVTTLGLIAQSGGRTEEARRLFSYANALSRRELQTQLWAIEDAVGRNDIRGALAQYDIALRTSRHAPELLYPVLAAALSDPAIRDELARTLGRRPSWSPTFVTYLAEQPLDPPATADLFAKLRRTGLPVPEEASALLIAALANKGMWDLAWSYYATVRVGADRRQSRDPDFSTSIKFPSLFDWMPVNGGGVATSLQSGERGGAFVFSAPPSANGLLLQQAQMLAPGSYRLEGRSSGVDLPVTSQPYWALSCRGGPELGRIAVSSSAQANGIFAGRFVVPTGCPLQTLALVARPSESMSGSSGQIDRVQLRPTS